MADPQKISMCSFAEGLVKAFELHPDLAARWRKLNAMSEAELAARNEHVMKLMDDYVAKAKVEFGIPDMPKPPADQQDEDSEEGSGDSEDKEELVNVQDERVVGIYIEAPPAIRANVRFCPCCGKEGWPPAVQPNN